MLIVSSYDNLDSAEVIKSVQSFINSKLDHEQKSTEFIKEIRRRLYFLHESNCQVAKDTSQYPRTKEFDLLLIKYIQLEFEALYSNSSLSKQLEIKTEQSVLRLLQVMLYPAVHNNEPLISAHTDNVLKQTVLQLLEQVGAKFLVENKLVCNIANKLLKRTNISNKSLKTKKSQCNEINRNSVTSDYGSDDSDSDFDCEIVRNYFLCNTKRTPQEKQISDCVEVPLTSHGAAPIPTIEFVDDDNYFVYLQKPENRKRKIKNVKANPTKKTFSGKQTDAVSNNFTNGKKIVKNSPSKYNNENSVQSSNVVVLSDSEDEVTLNSTTEITAEKQSGKKPKEYNYVNKPLGVVTFEILDDDDDDNEKPNYMVYLQKEVETKKSEMKTSQPDSKEIIVCFDSEDEQLVETGVEDNLKEKQSVKEEDLNVEDHLESKITVEEVTICKPDSGADLPLIVPPQTDFEHVASKVPEKCVSREDSSIAEKELACSKDFKYLGDNQLNMCTEGSIGQVNSDFHIFDSEFPLNVEENFLIDPSVIFQPMSHNHLSEGDTSTPVGNLSEPDGLGGPLLTEKSSYSQDLDNTQECRLHESFLEEVLMDDNYLLEGQKEFEELESFLFNDSAEKQGFFLSNISYDDSETVVQPSTFDADVTSLESLLRDSQLFNMKDFKSSSCPLNISKSYSRSEKHIESGSICKTKKSSR